MLARSVHLNARTIRAAVVLSGCGVYDGSEIHESVSLLIHLQRAGAEVQCYSPFTQQKNIVNHATGAQEGTARDINVEAARINRGAVGDIAALQPDAFDLLVFPGGFGVMKNLSTFALEGKSGSVIASVASVIAAAHKTRKPIAALCIAPVLLGKVLGTANGGPGLTLTTGSATDDTAGLLRALGNHPVECDGRSAVVDLSNRIITSPAYMIGDANAAMVYDGAGVVVEKALSIACSASTKYLF